MWLDFTGEIVMTNKVRIKLVTIGYLPKDFSIEKVQHWNSEVFQLLDGVEKFSLRTNSDGEQWDFSTPSRS